MTDLYLIRHAETETNLIPERIWGRSNHVKLTENGKRQALALYERLQNEKIEFDEIYVSPAVRTLHTLCLAVPNYQQKPYKIMDDLQELYQGDWTGRLRSEVYTPEIKFEMERDPWNFKAPNGESQAEVAKRMVAALQDIVKRDINGNKKIGIFTHGYSVRASVAELLNTDKRIVWKWHIDNTSITQMRYENNLFWPVRVNDCTHIYGIN